MRKERERILAAQKAIKEKDLAEKLEKKRRREENEKRRLENERKSEQVQVVRTFFQYCGKDVNLDDENDI